MTERSDPIVVDQNAIQQATETGNACKPFAWSIPAELLKILVVADGGRGTNTAIGIAQNVKEVEVNVVVARGGGSKSVQMELAQAARQGILAGESKTKVRFLDGQLTWNLSFATERETRIAAAWDAWHMLGQFSKKQVDFKFKCNVFKATIQGALLSGLCAFEGQNGSFTSKELFPLEACQNKLARRLVAMTRRNCGGEPNKQQIPIKVLCQLQWNQNSTLGLGQKNDSRKFKNMTCPTSKCWRQFLDKALGQIPLHDERWEADGKAVSR